MAEKGFTLFEYFLFMPLTTSIPLHLLFSYFTNQDFGTQSIQGAYQMCFAVYTVQLKHLVQ